MATELDCLGSEGSPKRERRFLGGHVRRVFGYVSLLVLAFAYGLAAGRFELFPFEQVQGVWRAATLPAAEETPDGRWFRGRDRSTPDAPAAEKIDGLSRLGYLGGYSTASAESGVMVYEAGAVQEGLTLFSSGHAPAVLLISTTGEVVHEWNVSFDELWPGELPFETTEEQRQFIRRARLFPSGDLLVIFEYIGIARLDRDSNVVWKSLGRNHHDIAINDDESIVSLVRQPVSPEEMARKYPGFDAPDGILDDHLVFLSPSGIEQKRVSLFDAIYRSDYALLLNGKQSDFPPYRDASGAPDIMHANSVDVIDNADPVESSVLANGDVLISLRNLNTVVSVDPDEGIARWALTGKWKMQHQAQLLNNGNLLLLDNLGGNPDEPFKLDASEVLEVNPLTQEVAWRYGGSEESPFYTYFLGYVQRLPNGNTLITESTQGRVFEVTEEGRVVWEYLNPHRAGDDGELIATIVGAQRIAAETLIFLED